MDRDAVFRVWELSPTKTLLYCKSGDSCFYFSSLGKWTKSGMDPEDFEQVSVAFSREALLEYASVQASGAQLAGVRDYWSHVVRWLL